MGTGTLATRSALESNQDKLEFKECNEEVRKQETGTRKELGVFDHLYMVGCQLDLIRTGSIKAGSWLPTTFVKPVGISPGNRFFE